MNRFCGKCGAPLQEGYGFCGSCGTGAPQQTSPAPQQAFQPVAQPAAAQAVPVPAAAAQASSPWLKIVLVTFVVVFVCGVAAVGGVIYIAHKVSQKAHEYSREVLGEASPATAATDSGSSSSAAAPGDKSAAAIGDPCLLLSKQVVSKAIGIDIVETSPADGGCSYLARGTAADMAAKHAAAMMAAKGADKKTQGLLEQFAGAVGNSMPKNAGDDTQSADGNGVVFTFGIDTNAARDQMHLNAKVLGGLGTAAQQPLEGIGDEAFAEADSMMMVRKGDKLIRIMYMSCPCNTDAIKPLARQLAASL